MKTKETILSSIGTAGMIIILIILTISSIFSLESLGKNMPFYLIGIVVFSSIGRKYKKQHKEENQQKKE